MKDMEHYGNMIEKSMTFYDYSLLLAGHTFFFVSLVSLGPLMILQTAATYGLYVPFMCLCIMCIS